MMPEHDLPAAVGPKRLAAAAHRHVFVYGTLRAGGSNDIRRYQPMPQRIGCAMVPGTLYDFGGWPGLQLQGGGDVTGEIWRIDPVIEPLLDRLEGVREDGRGDYLKRTLTLTVGGSAIACLLYEIHPDRVLGRPVILGGDWIAHVGHPTRRV